MKRYLLTTVSCLAMATAASAADMPVKALSPVAAVSPWAGPYVGVNGGVVWHRLRTDTDLAGFGPYDSARINTTGGTFGGQIGYNFVSQNFLYGLEADLNWLNAKGTDQHIANNGLGFGVIHTTKLSWLGTLRVRGGTTFGPNLLYLTGGLAVGGVDNSWTYVPGITCGAGFSCDVTNKKTRAGWTAGGGIERFISNPNMTVKAEVLYVDLGSSTVTSPLGYTSRFRNTAVIGRLGLNLKW